MSNIQRWVVVLVGLVICAACQDPSSREQSIVQPKAAASAGDIAAERAREDAVRRRREATYAAYAIVKKQLLSPAGAKEVDSKVIDQDGNRFLVHELVDAPNVFGAQLRGSFCVVMTLDEKDPSRFTYSIANAVQKCSDPPTVPEVAIMKTINGWKASAAEVKAIVADAKERPAPARKKHRRSIEPEGTVEPEQPERYPAPAAKPTAPSSALLDPY